MNICICQNTLKLKTRSLLSDTESDKPSIYMGCIRVRCSFGVAKFMKV